MALFFISMLVIGVLAGRHPIKGSCDEESRGSAFGSGAPKLYYAAEK